MPILQFSDLYTIWPVIIPDVPYSAERAELADCFIGWLRTISVFQVHNLKNVYITLNTVSSSFWSQFCPITHNREHGNSWDCFETTAIEIEIKYHIAMETEL